MVGIVFLLAGNSASYADHYGMIQDGWEARIRDGVFKVASADFENGIVIFDEYINLFPNDPAGYFFSAAAVKEKMQKSNNMSEIKRFYNYAKTGKRLCKKRLRKNKSDYIARLYLGAIQGYIGLLEVKRGRLIRALFNAIDSKSNLEKVAKNRPEIPDTYFGLGLLYYFSSLKSKNTGGISGWIIKKFITNGKDLSKKGMELTIRSINEGSLGLDYAKSALVWMRFYEKEYDETALLANEMSQRFPSDIASRWILGRVALIRDDCDSAKEWFTEIKRINEENGLPAAKFPDLDAVLKMSELCKSVEQKRWERVDILKKDISDWLDDDPKIVIEYQDHKSVIASWKEKVNQFATRKSSALTN